MAIGTAAAIVGGSIISGVLASKSASKAARAQTAGQDASIAEQRRQFDATQASLQPFQQTGQDALNQQRILLGLGGTTTDPNAAQRQQLQSQIANLQQPQGGGRGQFGRGSEISNFSRARSVNESMGALRGGSSAEQAELQAQLDALPEFTQGNAQEQQQVAFDALNESPGQQFLRDRAQKNLLRNSSAIGGLGGGNVRSALVEQGVGFAQQDLQNQFGRLGQLAGQGQNAATSIGQFGQQSANNISNAQSNIGSARSSGIINQGNAIQGAFSGALQGAAQGGFFGGGSPPVQTGSFQQTGQFSGNTNPFAVTG